MASDYSGHRGVGGRAGVRRGIFVAGVGSGEVADAAEEETVDVARGRRQTLDDGGEGGAGDRYLRDRQLTIAVGGRGGGGHGDRRRVITSAKAAEV